MSHPLPPVLQEALARAGFSGLTDLALACGYKPQTFWVVRCGARRPSAIMAARIGAALSIPPGLVQDLIMVRKPGPKAAART